MSRIKKWMDNKIDFVKARVGGRIQWAQADTEPVEGMIYGAGIVQGLSYLFTWIVLLHSGNAGNASDTFRALLLVCGAGSLLLGMTGSVAVLLKLSRVRLKCSMMAVGLFIFIFVATVLFTPYSLGGLYGIFAWMSGWVYIRLRGVRTE